MHIPLIRQHQELIFPPVRAEPQYAQGGQGLMCPLVNAPPFKRKTYTFAEVA